MGNLDDSIDYVEAALEAHKISPDNHIRMLAAQYGTWCNVAMSLNQPLVAREKGLQSFRLNQRHFERTQVVDSQYVASYSELGRIMIMNGELDEAERLIQESARLRRQLPHFTRLHLYSPILFYSYIEVIRGQFESAEAHLLQALRDREAKYGKNDTESKR
jgi:tetratricopeptide (TPR) repeat protein